MFGSLKPPLWLVALGGAALFALYTLYIDHGGYERANSEWKAKYSAGLAQAKQDWIDKQASITQAATPQNDAITKAVANLNGAAAKLRTTYATTGKPLAVDCLLDPERVQLANTFLKTQ